MGKRKKPKVCEEIKGRRKPKNVIDPESYLSKKPSWVFYRCDLNGEWSILKCSNFKKNIMDKLIDYEGIDWARIIQASGGRSHGTNNHFIPITDLTKEAQKRAELLHIHEDQIFSLRLTGKERLFGLVNDGVFEIIWYDDCHGICPCKQ